MAKVRGTKKREVISFRLDQDALGDRERDITDFLTRLMWRYAQGTHTQYIIYFGGAKYPIRCS